MHSPRRNDILADCSSRPGAIEDLKLPSLADPSAVAQRPCSFGDRRHTSVGNSHDLVTMYSLGFIKHNESADGMADTYILRRRLRNTYLKDSLNTTPRYQGSSATSTQFQSSMPSSELESFLAQLIRKRDVFFWQTEVGTFDGQYDEQSSRRRDRPQDSEMEETIPE